MKTTLSRGKFLQHSISALGGFCLLPASSLLEFIGLKNIQIVIPKNHSSDVYDSARLLKELLSVDSDIVIESAQKLQNSIILGESKYSIKNGISSVSLSDDGYIIKRIKNNVVVLGDGKNGLNNGIYSLLENLGYRKYTSEDPISRPLEYGIQNISNQTQTIIPKIKYRTTSYYDAQSPDYSAWHKLSSRDSWGLFVHTFETLIAPEKYGKSNPEYFSLIDGKRNPATQLCLSNEAVFYTLVEELSKKISQNPDAKYWSVSQNDNDKYCRCENCTKINEEYGGVPSGSVAWFTNKVAKKFPDKIISTLAYWYTRKAPRNIEMEPNVNIMLCNIESTREKPVYDTDPDFTKDLQDWGRISSDILIWDYNIQFANPMSPFPNLHTIGPNIKFYIQNNVKALFMQATSNKGEFGHLRAYLLSKLMWDPLANDADIIDDFVNGYYGLAAPFIKAYIELMQSELLSSGFRLNIFGDPRDAVNSFLSSDLRKRYKELFDRAESVVSSSSVYLERVREDRLPLDFAEIQISCQIPPENPDSFYCYNDQGRVTIVNEKKAHLEQFLVRSKNAGIERIGERAISLEEYKMSFDRIFMRMEETKNSPSYRKKVISKSNPKKGITDLLKLTDGIYGAYESWRFPLKENNWISFEGEHMDIILDLEIAYSINYVGMDFLNVQAQANWHQLALPPYVEYSLSLDGVNFDNGIRIDFPFNQNPAENPEIVKIPFYHYRADFLGTKARYIKIYAENLIKMPSWHINEGKPCSLFTDEIILSAD